MDLDELHERLLFIEDQMHAGLLNDAKKKLAQLIRDVAREKEEPQKKD